MKDSHFHVDVRSVNDVKKLAKLGSKENTVPDTTILIYSKNCGPCHDFLPQWKQFVKSNTTNTISIEVGLMDRLSTVPHIRSLVNKSMKRSPFVPNVSKLKNGRVYMFKGERSTAGLQSF